MSAQNEIDCTADDSHQFVLVQFTVTVLSRPNFLENRKSMDATKKSAAKKAAVAKKPAQHPSYKEMIVEALGTLRERNGSSRQKIYAYILKNFKVSPDDESVKRYLRTSLKKLVTANVIVQSKGVGASGSFKLPVAPKKAAVKKTVAKKPATKTAAKKTTTKKAPASAKKSPKKTKTAAKKSSAKSPKKPKSKVTKKPVAKKSPAPKKAKKTTKAKSAAKKTAAKAKPAKK